MPLLNTQLRVAVRHVARAAAVVLAQPHVDVVNLCVCVDKLDREREAVHARVGERNATARHDADAAVIGICAVKRDGIWRVGRGRGLVCRVPERAPVAQRAARARRARGPNNARDNGNRQECVICKPSGASARGGHQRNGVVPVAVCQTGVDVGGRPRDHPGLVVAARGLGLDRNLLPDR